jgi:hypothetical protein
MVNINTLETGLTPWDMDILRSVLGMGSLSRFIDSRRNCNIALSLMGMIDNPG